MVVFCLFVFLLIVSKQVRCCVSGRAEHSASSEVAKSNSLYSIYYFLTNIHVYDLNILCVTYISLRLKNKKIKTTESPLS